MTALPRALAAASFCAALWSNRYTALLSVLTIVRALHLKVESTVHNYVKEPFQLPVILLLLLPRGLVNLCRFDYYYSKIINAIQRPENRFGWLYGTGLRKRNSFRRKCAREAESIEKEEDHHRAGPGASPRVERFCPNEERRREECYYYGILWHSPLA